MLLPLSVAGVSLVSASDELLPLVELYRRVAEHQHVAQEEHTQRAERKFTEHYRVTIQVVP